MAKLMLYRDVLKHFGQLPVKAQKKVLEFIRKFQEDSAQAGLHLEPYAEAVDPKVHSARIGDDYRAIVIAPQQGDTFLLMHVDHHDEAYRWCRNKRFETHPALGVLQVFDVQQATAALAEQTETPTAAPAHEYPLAHLSDDELFQAGVPKALIPAVRAIHSDTAFQETADYLPKEAAQVLYGIVCGMSLDESLAEMLGEPEPPLRKPAGPGDFSQLDRVAHLDLVLVEGEEQLKAMLAEDIEEWRIFLHPYQRKLVTWKTPGPIKLYGAAGTGKTVALLHRAVHLANGLQTPKDKVLVTTYTTTLSVTLEQLLERLSPTAAGKIEVTNLHWLAKTICARAGWQGRIAEVEEEDELWQAVLATMPALPFEPDFIRDEYALVIDDLGLDSEDAYLTAVRSGRPRLDRKQRRQLWPLFLEFNRWLHQRRLLTFEGVVHQARLVVEAGGFPGYRHVLVDELQDFSLEALRLVAALSPLRAGLSDSLCLVGDGHQRLYRRAPVPLARAGIDVKGRSRRLKINYRTSEQIRRWAHGLLHGIPVDDLDGGTAEITGDRSVFRGPEPRIEPARDDADVAHRIVYWIDGLLHKAGLSSHEICVTPGFDAVRTALESAGIKTLELQVRQADPGQAEPGVRLGSIARIKGLEFKAVALVIDHRRPVKAGDALHARFEHYVAATRAREWLLVLTLE
ncbi:MAG: AAA family ATPase [Candidatus Competibacteraceae bacterium]